MLFDDRLGTLNYGERLSELVITQKDIPTEMLNEVIVWSMGVQMIFVVSEDAGEVGGIHWAFSSSSSSSSNSRVYKRNVT